MWNSNDHYCLLQQGHGNLEAESEESESLASQGTESSQEETGHLEPWSSIFHEAEKRHETQLKALINQYEVSGDSENAACISFSALLPGYKKEVRKVLLEYLQWMRAMIKDPTFRKVMETQKELKRYRRI